jgi:hypothetical protein
MDTQTMRWTIVANTAAGRMPYDTFDTREEVEARIVEIREAQATNPFCVARRRRRRASSVEQITPRRAAGGVSGRCAVPRSDARSEQVRLLACEIAERRTGMPSYLVDDEAWEAAMAEAEATYEPPKPLSPLQEAVRKAEGKHLTAGEIAESIGFLNRAAATLKGRRS